MNLVLSNPFLPFFFQFFISKRLVDESKWIFFLEFFSIIYFFQFFATIKKLIEESKWIEKMESHYGIELRFSRTLFHHFILFFFSIFRHY